MKTIFLSTLIALCTIAQVKSIDVYEGSAGPISTIYTIELTNNDSIYHPHVYMMGGDDYSDMYIGSTVNWIDFAQESNDTTLVKIARVDEGIFPSHTHIRPISYNIPVNVSGDGKSIEFTVVGNKKSISLHWGTDETNTFTREESDVKSIHVFVSSLPSLDSSDADLYFGPGVHSINDAVDDRGVFTVPTDSFTIVIARGSWVKGKITAKSVNGTRIEGGGVLSGEAFDYHERKNNDIDGEQAINAMSNTIFLKSITVVNTSNHGIYIGGNSNVRETRLFGWSGNQDGFHIRGSAILEHCFVKSGDDLYRRMSGGASTPSIVRNCVAWQHVNGYSFMCGWQYGSGSILFDDCDVIRAEFRVTDNNQRGVLAVWRNGDATASQTKNVWFNNIRIDESVPRPIAMRMDNNSYGYIKDIFFTNILIRGKVLKEHYIYTTTDAPADDKNISYVYFQNVRYKPSGQSEVLLTEANAKDASTWKGNIYGNISNIFYSDTVSLPDPNADDNKDGIPNFADFTESAPEYFYVENASEKQKLKSDDGTTLILGEDNSSEYVWHFIEAPEDNYYFIENLKYGTRLKSIDGATTFALADESGDAVQWAKELTGSNYFLVNKQWGERLKATSTSTFDLTMDFGIRVQWILTPYLGSTGTFETTLNNNEIELYPNPAKTILFIDSKQNSGSIEIYNVSGTKVFDSTIINGINKLDISNLQNGCFILAIKDESILETRKLIVNK